MTKKLRIWIVVSLGLLGTAFGVEKFFDRTVVYECTNRLTGLPVFIKVRTYGVVHIFEHGDSWVDADYHHPDGDVYVYSGKDSDYFDDGILARWVDSPWLDETTGETGTSDSTVFFDLLTGSYTINVEIKGKTQQRQQLIASGFCVRK